MTKQKEDTVLKEFWRDNERFSDLFNTVLFGGNQIIKPEELMEQDTDVSRSLDIPSHRKSLARTRDVIRKSNGVADFVVLGIENQMKVHYAMPLRTMIYDGLSYLKAFDEIVKHNRQERNITLSSAEFLSGFRKEDRLHPVVTIVIYYGEDPWDGPDSLVDMLSIPKELEGLVSNYRMNLLEVRDSEQYRFSNEEVETVFDVTRKIYRKQYEELENTYGDKTISYELFKVITTISNSEELLEKAACEEKGEVRMCRALEEWANQKRAEGIKEGIKAGIKEGINDIIGNMLRNGLRTDEIIKYAGVSYEVVMEVKKSIEC